MSFEKIFGILVFSAIGYAYYRYAKKRPSYVTLLCAMFLMFFSYFCEEIWQIYLYGTVATLLPYINYLRAHP